MPSIIIMLENYDKKNIPDNKLFSSLSRFTFVFLKYKTSYVLNLYWAVKAESKSPAKVNYIWQVKDCLCP